VTGRCNPRQSETRHIVLGESAAHHLWGLRIGDSARSQAVEAEDRFVIGIVDREDGFSATEIVTLAA